MLGLILWRIIGIMRKVCRRLVPMMRGMAVGIRLRRLARWRGRRQAVTTGMGARAVAAGHAVARRPRAQRLRRRRQAARRSWRTVAVK